MYCSSNRALGLLRAAGLVSMEEGSAQAPVLRTIPMRPYDPKYDGPSSTTGEIPLSSNSNQSPKAGGTSLLRSMGSSKPSGNSTPAVDGGDINNSTTDYVKFDE